MNSDEQYLVCLSYVEGYVDGLHSTIPVEKMKRKPYSEFYTRMTAWEDVIMSKQWQEGVVAAITKFYRDLSNQDKPIIDAVFFYTISLLPAKSKQ